MVTSAELIDAILYSPAFAPTARSNTTLPTVKLLVAKMRSALRRSLWVITTTLPSVEGVSLASRGA
eukprot:8322339-Pyramimonas_sp.AAC.1